MRGFEGLVKRSLVIAAIIGKGHGVKVALLGMVVSTLVIVLGYGLLLMLAMAH